MKDAKLNRWSGVFIVSASLLVLGLGLVACQKEEEEGTLEKLGKKADEKLDKVWQESRGKS